jgi:hypothetical protein
MVSNLLGTEEHDIGPMMCSGVIIETYLVNCCMDSGLKA